MSAHNHSARRTDNPAGESVEKKPASPNGAYLQAPKVIHTPGLEYASSTRRFQGIPSIACGDAGRLWAVWYGGTTPGEDRNNYVMLAFSDDAGHHWSDEKLVIDPDGPGPVRAFDPEIWLAPNGQLWLFWAQGTKEEHLTSRSGVWAMTADESAGAQATWSAPRRLADGVMMCKPVVLSSGEWCLPISLWHRRKTRSASAWISSNLGRDWTERGACDVPPDVRIHDEHMIVERLDRSLWMLVRTKYGIGESISPDGGRNWSELHPLPIAHPSSRFFIRRLQSGRILLVRHDPPRGYAEKYTSMPRSHLTAFLSEDDGHSWPYRLLLDERHNVSYPDGDQAADGTIHVIHDYQRTKAKEILMSSFREEDVIHGRPVTEQARLTVLVNKATSQDDTQ